MQSCRVLDRLRARANKEVVAVLRHLSTLRLQLGGASRSELPSERSINFTFNLIREETQAESVLAVQSEPNQMPLRIHPLLHMINCVGARSLPGPPELGIEWRFDLYEELENERARSTRSSPPTWTSPQTLFASQRSMNRRPIHLGPASSS